MITSCRDLTFYSIAFEEYVYTNFCKSQLPVLLSILNINLKLSSILPSDLFDVLRAAFCYSHVGIQTEQG
jgi:hypothetical protein